MKIRMLGLLILMFLVLFSCYPLRNTDNANVLPAGAVGGSLGATWAKGIDSTQHNTFGMDLKAVYSLNQKTQIGFGAVNALGFYSDIKYNWIDSDAFNFSNGLTYGVLDQYFSLPVFTTFKVQENIGLVVNARVGHTFVNNFDDSSNPNYPLTNISRRTFRANTLWSAEIGLERINLIGVKFGFYNFKNELADSRENFITFSISTNFHGDSNRRFIFF